MSESKSGKPDVSKGKPSKAQRAPAKQQVRQPGGLPSGVPPALVLSMQYGNLKKVGREVAEILKVYDLSISSAQRAIADYAQRKLTFQLNREILLAVQKFETAKAEWESFRDSHKSSTDSSSVPTGLVASLLGDSGAASAAPGIQGK